MPIEHPAPDPESRRTAIARALGGVALFASAPSFLAGCASGAKHAELPDVHWPEEPMHPARRAATPPKDAWHRPVAPDTALPTGVIARSNWTTGTPVPRLMDPMLPVRRITLHHDGMTTFTSTGRADAGARIELIRVAHRGRGWGDIGYHFLVDPAGRIWQGRPLSWQGAHVKAQNEGNIGVCVLGNYEQQRPTPRQVAAVGRFTAGLMQRYRVRTNEVFTHRELAQTACPGRFLQPRLVAARKRGGALYLA